MLLNWFLSSITENNHLKNLLNPQDLKNLGVQYCTHLLAAGVLRQISDKNAPTENIFKVILNYFVAFISLVENYCGELSETSYNYYDYYIGVSISTFLIILVVLI